MLDKRTIKMMQKAGFNATPKEAMVSSIKNLPAVQVQATFLEQFDRNCTAIMYEAVRDSVERILNGQTKLSQWE